MVKLDFGCGKNKQPGFIGVDSIAFEGVDLIGDLSQKEWRFETAANEYLEPVEDLDAYADSFTDIIKQKVRIKSNSVDEVFSSHFLEHLTGQQRISFFNELHRVMKPGAKATIITPDWSNACAYGDPTHQWPPMSSWYVLYLNKAWRDANAPHVGYTCDFDWATGGSWDEWLHVRNMETRLFAMQHYINSQRDLHVNLTKR